MDNYFSYDLETLVNDNDHIAGDPNAKITLVEYGDYQCPYCGRAYPIVKKLQEDFKSDLRFVFRNFPLTQIHEYAFEAAESAELADKYGKFWEMHDKIYEHQNKLDMPHLVSYAESLGINGTEFFNRLETNETAKKVKSDFMSGVESGVNGTPSFFINGKKYDGPWEYEDLKQVLTQMIGKE
ncbi:MAG: DsbA family protein [Saprospiraceae bacterium]|nr:DsbA family protein [Saprospiraceae bacterium]MCB9327252.1 DsbA family protein [Lewinellaceae bacterium]